MIWMMLNFDKSSFILIYSEIGQCKLEAFGLKWSGFFARILKLDAWSETNQVGL